jgi:hypothetical protein
METTRLAVVKRARDERLLNKQGKYEKQKKQLEA